MIQDYKEIVLGVVLLLWVVITVAIVLWDIEDGDFNGEEMIDE